MIHIHATKKLYAKLPHGTKIDSLAVHSGMASGISATATNPLGDWHANLITVQRRNCVLLVHDATRFPLFMIGLLKADFAKFDWLFADILMNTLLKIGANQPQLDTAAALLTACSFDTDCNRSVQGTMNQMKGDIEHMFWHDNARIDQISAYQTGAWLADRPCRAKGQKGCIWPKEAMLSLLSQEVIPGRDEPKVDNIVRLADYRK